MLSGGTDVNINLLPLNTRELENQSHQQSNSHFHIGSTFFSGNNGLVKPALNAISVFLKLLWMLQYITHSTMMVKIFTINATFVELNHVHVNSHFNLGKSDIIHCVCCVICDLLCMDK